MKYGFAILGFFLTNFQFYGALVGYAIGYIVEIILKPSQGNQQQSNQSDYQDYFNSYQNPYGVGQQNDFISILLVLSAAVMKADGKVLKTELNFLKSFFQQQFGHRFTQQHLLFLKETLDKDAVNVNEVCSFLRYRTTEEVRIQLIHYLFGIAKADNHVSDKEIEVISRIARQLHVSEADFMSVKNMFYRNPSSDYTILGISQDASNDEIKKAYRKMAVKYHPDKVQDMGEEHQKAAREKFQQIQAAYENIKKIRNIK